MPEAPADIPLQIDAIECSRVGTRNVLVRVDGRLRSRRPSPNGRSLLVIEADGRRHRFPSIPDPKRGRIHRPGRWSARFAIPAWLEDRLGEDATIWLGTVEIPIPAGAILAGNGARLDAPPDSEEHANIKEAPMRRGSRNQSSDLASEVAARVREALEQAETESPEPSAEEQTAGEPGAGESGGVPAGSSSEPGTHEPLVSTRSGFEREQQIVAALRAELQERAAAEVQLRAELAEARGALESQTRTQTDLEATHVELRRELNELLDLVKDETNRRSEVESKAVVLAAEVAELQEQVAQHDEVDRHTREQAQDRERSLSAEVESARSELAAAIVEREAVSGEVAGLRAEIQRLNRELDEMRVRERARESGLDEAQSLLSEARALTATLRAQSDRLTTS